MSRIVVLSPSRYSLYTTTVSEMLLRRGVRIEAIVVRRMFNLSRLTSELRRDGKRLVRKAYKKLVLREKTYGTSVYQTIVDLREELGITYPHVEALSEARQIPVHYCDDFNSARALDVMQQAQPDLVVFTGGGIIRRDLIERSGQGILNCHMGLLPEYKGMDVVEWAVLENRPDKVGVTVHFMDEGIDTGDLVLTRAIGLDDVRDFVELRQKFEPVTCQAMTEAAVGLLEGSLQRAPQPDEGKQYFILHPELYDLALARLQQMNGVASATS